MYALNRTENFLDSRRIYGSTVRIFSARFASVINELSIIKRRCIAVIRNEKYKQIVTVNECIYLNFDLVFDSLRVTVSRAYFRNCINFYKESNEMSIVLARDAWKPLVELTKEIAYEPPCMYSKRSKRNVSRHVGIVSFPLA